MRVTRTRTTDPTRVRLSKHILLSDLMGCHSVYAKGLPNVFIDPTGGKLAEARHLCETLIEPIIEQYGPVSFSYGYISPELSRQVVSYQDPDLPSYHRWDKGAAVDVCVHSWVRKDAPIFLAHDIAESLGFSRMITYSESPYICLATQLSEGDRYRRAFYENRYEGSPRAKPLYIQKPSNPALLPKSRESVKLKADWRGAGHPTYHGKGIRQFHHIRVGKYCMMSDFLYSTHAVSRGVANAPTPAKFMDVFKEAGAMYDYLLRELDVARLSIVRGFESFRFNDYPLFSWNDHFAFEVVPPEGTTALEVADAALSSGMASAVSTAKGEDIVRIIGKG